MPTRRLFAIIPAAGLSVRMGQPKLLMRLGEQTLIARVLAVLGRSKITATVVVVRGSDGALQGEVRRAGGTVVSPEVDPPDMRSSVELAIAAIQEAHYPRPDDGWLLIPADHPLLDAELLGDLIPAWNETDEPILVPTHQGRRGHPTFFRWSLATDVAKIPAGQGLNWLLHQPGMEIREVPVDNDAVLWDIDTPDDFARLQARWRGESQ